MTAVRNWDVVGPQESDADLAMASSAGDRRAFADIYDRYADRLHDFCAGMLGDRESAADCVQDAFCIAATRLPQLREPDKLRPWLYSIVRNEALRRIRERRRETPSDALPDQASGEPGPEMMAARTELADLIADAAGGLSDRDRAVLELAYRHGLSGADLAEALEVSTVAANTIASRLRDTIERSLGALLVSRQVRNFGGCQELEAILEGWDGQLNVLMRKRISRHIESCDICEQQRRRLVTPAALFGAAPVFIPAPAWLRERTLGEVRLTSASKPIGNARQDRPRDKSFLLPGALFVAALIAAAASTFIWFNQKDPAITPTDVSVTTSIPTVPPSVPVVAPPPPPPPTVEKTVAPPPVQQTPVVEPPASAAPPPTSEPTVEVPSEEPPPPPPPPVSEPPPPPVWPEWLPPLVPSPPASPPPGAGSAPPLIINPVPGGPSRP